MDACGKSHNRRQTGCSGSKGAVRTAEPIIGSAISTRCALRYVVQDRAVSSHHDCEIPSGEDCNQLFWLSIAKRKEREALSFDDMHPGSMFCGQGVLTVFPSRRATLLICVGLAGRKWPLAWRYTNGLLVARWFKACSRIGSSSNLWPMTIELTLYW